MKPDSVKTSKPLSTTAKSVLSIVLLVYLFLLVLGPLANPVASAHLTGPISRFFAPVHRMLFMGHGYRFFAPNPGPSHLVEYEIERTDGSRISGHFPDANDPNQSFPRLKYHRWFMLSESIWSDYSTTPVAEDFQASQRHLEKLATQKQIAGHPKSASALRRERAQQRNAYQRQQKRVDMMIESVAKGLLALHDGDRIRLFLRERSIPYPRDVIEGASLDEPRFLAPPRPILIGEFTAAELEREDVAPVGGHP